MQNFTVVVDYNGIVLFEPSLLRKFYGGTIEAGADLFNRFTATNEGDQVVDFGIVLPILGINDGIYRILIRGVGERSEIEKGVVFENAAFPLHVAQRLVVADLAVLSEWEDDLGWQDVDLPPGYYSVHVRGFRFVEENVVVDCGYEVVCTPERELTRRTGKLEMNMQVLCLPDSME